MIIYYDGKLAGSSPSYLAHLRVIYDKLSYEDPIQYTYVSRYSASRVIRDPHKKNKSYYESVNQTPIPENEADIYVETDKSTENRLDIISNKVYGTPLQWWVIAMANNIIDPFDVPMGTVLRIPVISSIYGVKGLMNL